MNLTINDCKLIMKAYDLGQVLHFKRLTKGYANVNYCVKTTTADFLLKIFLDKSIQDIHYEMRLLESLKAKQFPAAYPIKTKEQKYLQQTIFGNIVVFEFLSGSEPVLNMEVAKIIAKATAKLNSTANWKLYERPYLLHFNQCTQLIEHFAGAKNQYPDFFHFFEQQTKALEKAAAANLPIGLIHGDIFPDNTLFQNNKLIGIIDFEFASTAEVLIEIGVTINGFCFVNNELDMNLLQAFLSSYSKTRKIEPLELNLLHDYILMGTLLMLRWHLNHIMQHTSPKSFQRTSYFIQRMKGFQKMKRINYRMLLQD